MKKEIILPFAAAALIAVIPAFAASTDPGSYGGSSSGGTQTDKSRGDSPTGDTMSNYTGGGMRRMSPDSDTQGSSGSADPTAWSDPSPGPSSSDPANPGTTHMDMGGGYSNMTSSTKGGSGTFHGMTGM